MILKEKVHIDSYPFVVGIDFKSVSIAHKKYPSNIFNIISQQEKSLDKKGIVYLNSEKTFTKNHVSNLDPTEINQYFSSKQELGQPKKELIESKIITYLQQTLLAMIEDEKLIKKYDKDLKLESFVYYVSSSSAVHQSTIRTCFIRAGLIKDHELYRLTFVPGDAYTLVLFGLKTHDDEKSKQVIHNEPSADFIVGIDFGTTFSGCSYARKSEILGAIKTVRSDRSTTAVGDTDVINFPTCIIYEETDTEMILKYWGKQSKTTILQEDQLLLENFKLFMLSDTYQNEKQNIMKDTYSYQDGSIYNNRIEIVRVIADYLKLFTDYIDEYIHDHEVDLRRNSLDKAFRILKLEKKFNLKYILTVPDSWDQRSQSIFIEAAEMAKIITKEEADPSSFMVTELRAAALYYSHQVNKRSLPRSNEAFIMCDAGGATVNVGAFRIEDKSQTLVQIGAHDTDICGSMYLDENFENYIYEFYKDLGIHIDTTLNELTSIKANFVHHIKPNFISDKTKDSYYNVDLISHRSVSEYIKPEHTKKYLLVNNNRVLRIKNETLEKQVFDPIFKRIESMLDKQLKKGNIKTIVLVGGMARSKYLQQRLKSKYDGSKIQLEFLLDSVVSAGAVTYGINL
ncbi:hypothetical protein BD770DRAFT_444598 [Pilaira anomala]|nr:hypothetical protein BD770DRAFT_444598 [Pilaira anomala]